MGLGKGCPTCPNSQDVWYICRLSPVGSGDFPPGVNANPFERATPCPHSGHCGVNGCCQSKSHCCGAGGYRKCSNHSCGCQRGTKMEEGDHGDHSTVTEVTTEDQDVTDTSFKLHNFSDMASPEGDSPDQLTMVEEMVVEVKNGLVAVMGELAKIQSVEEKQKIYETQISQLTETVESQKTALNKMSDDMKILIQELQRNGQLSSHCKEKLNLKTEVTTPQSDFDSGLNLSQRCGSSGGATTPPGLSPMVKPFMESLPTGNEVKSGEDQYESDSASLTALASRCLQLTQTLQHQYNPDQDISSRESSHDEEDHGNSSFEDTLISDIKMSGGQRYMGTTNENQQHDKAFAEKQRQKLTSEILSSERKYCSTLWTLIDDYISPLRQMNLMSSRELNLIFPPYLTQMYAQHCSILRKLEDRVLNWRWNGCVGDIFAKLTDTQENDLLALYRDYVSDFPAALSNLIKWRQKSQKFARFLKNHHHGPGSQDTDVTALIISPVQRLAKYVLLIKDLLRFTDDNHSDRYYLVASLAILRNFLSQLNEEIQHVVQLVEDETSARRSSRSAASVKSSGSSCEVNQVLSARDSGIHCTGGDIVKLHQSPPPRQLVSRRNQKQDNQKYNRTVAESYSRRLRLATSQPNIHRMNGIDRENQRVDSPYSLVDGSALSSRSVTRERTRRNQGRRTLDSFPVMHSLGPQRSATPNHRHSAVPRLQLDEYYEPVMTTEPHSYRDESLLRRPQSVVGQSYIYEDYELDRLAQLAQNRPHSAAEVLLQDEMFHTDTEAQLQHMLEMQENRYPPQTKRNLKSRDRLSLTPDEELYGPRPMKKSQQQENRRLTGIDHLIESGLLMRTQPMRNESREEAYLQDYGIYGDNDDLDEEDEGDYRPVVLPEMAPPTRAERVANPLTNGTGNESAMLNNGYGFNGHVNAPSPPEPTISSSKSTSMKNQIDAIDDQLPANSEHQHISTTTLLQMTQGGSGDPTQVKPFNQTLHDNKPANEELLVTSVPPSASTLPRPDSRQGKATPVKLPKKKMQDKAKLGFSGTFSRSVDDVSKSKKKNSIRDSLKNIFNKKKGTTSSTGETPTIPCSSEETCPPADPQAVPSTDPPSSPSSAPQSPDWVLQGSNLSQITLTPLPRQKPPKKPPRARRPATLTGTFRDETGEPYSPV